MQLCSLVRASGVLLLFFDCGKFVQGPSQPMELWVGLPEAPGPRACLCLAVLFLS